MVRQEILYTKRESNFFTFSSGMAQMHDQLYWQFLSPCSQNWHSFDSHINSAVSPMWDWYIIIASSQKLVQSWWERFQLLIKGSTKMRTTHAESLFLKFYPVSCDMSMRLLSGKLQEQMSIAIICTGARRAQCPSVRKKNVKKREKQEGSFTLPLLDIGLATLSTAECRWSSSQTSCLCASSLIESVTYRNLKTFENGMRNKKISNITFASSTF